MQLYQSQQQQLLISTAQKRKTSFAGPYTFLHYSSWHRKSWIGKAQDWWSLPLHFSETNSWASRNMQMQNKCMWELFLSECFKKAWSRALETLSSRFFYYNCWQIWCFRFQFSVLYSSRKCHQKTYASEHGSYCSFSLPVYICMWQISGKTLRLLAQPVKWRAKLPAAMLESSASIFCCFS